MRPSVESYAHRMAKLVVVGWLRDSARGREDQYVDDPLGINWRVNRGPPLFGVYEECPILADGTGILPCWDETWSNELGAPPPTFKDLVKAGTPPIAILDIAVQHKGQVSCGIEIVHKNPPTQKKLDLLYALPDPPKLLVIPASWILRQVGVPKKAIPREFWYWGGPR
jgi:hypothetical protein